jgi:hypothetical protein
LAAHLSLVDIEKGARKVQPSKIASHDFFKEPMFAPGKQYIDGLHLLCNDARTSHLLQEFKRDLSELGAPPCPEPDGKAEREVLDTWFRAVADQEPRNARWWATVEKYTLLALAVDPGMGLGIFAETSEVADLAVLKCDAAKWELYLADGADPPSRPIVVMHYICCPSAKARRVCPGRPLASMTSQG